jgi:hypothetical protein
VVKQDLLRIDEAIEDGSFYENEALRAACRTERLHLLGLVSDGGVHSSLDHLRALAELARRGELPAEDTVAFSRLAGGSARVIAETVGSPPTWPASWLFAWRHGRPPAQYDLLVGRYLFYRQNNLGGLIPVGTTGDDVLLGEGWGPRTEHEGVPARGLAARARLFAPLDVPEDLDVLWRVAGAGTPAHVVVYVNGHPAGRFTAQGGWREHRQRVRAAYWRRELNEIVLEPAGGAALVASVQVLRATAPPGEERGAREW